MVWDTRARRDDAERYLRELAARVLPADGTEAKSEPTERGQTLHLASPAEMAPLRRLRAIFNAGEALVAIGAIEPYVVDEIATQYAQTGHGRGNKMVGRELKFGASQIRPRPAPIELRPVTIACGPIEVPMPWGDITIRFVRFEHTRTVLSITGRLSASSSSEAGRHHPLREINGPRRRLTVVVADDRGTSSQAHFSGGGRGEDEIDGQLATIAPMSTDTAWLELDGRRIELRAHEPADAEVHLEKLATPPTALAYLWHKVAILGRPLRHPPLMSGLEATIAALVAIDAIDAEDPELDAMRRVLGALWNIPGTEAHGPFPEPWSSVLVRRARGNGAMCGTLSLEVVTPAVDGISVCAHALEATPERFVIEMELAPDGPLAWWAEDDRGGVYLGYGEGIEGSPEHSSTRAVFLGGLDADVEELRFMPTGITERALLHIPMRGRLRST